MNLFEAHIDTKSHFKLYILFVFQVFRCCTTNIYNFFAYLVYVYQLMLVTPFVLFAKTGLIAQFL